MNSGACGGNDGDGGRDKDGKTPEQRHREHIQQMDDLKRREEVLLDSTFLNFFFTPNFHTGPCSVTDNADVRVGSRQHKIAILIYG